MSGLDPLKTVAWDTSTAPTAVALLEDDRCVAADATATEARHGEVLLPRVRGLLESAGWDKRHVSLLVVGVGPGSFTGLRVGVATAKGWAVATGVPLVGVSSHYALAGPQLGSSELVVAVTDAFKGEVYMTAFAEQDGEPAPQSPPFHAKPQEACRRLAALANGRPVRMVGDGLERYPDAFAPDALAAIGLVVQSAATQAAGGATNVPCAETLGRLGRARFLRQGADDLNALAPLYIRDSDARLPATPLSL